VARPSEQGSTERLPLIVADRLGWFVVRNDAIPQGGKHGVIVAVIRLKTQNWPSTVRNQHWLTSFLDAAKDLECASLEVSLRHLS
jgi:hypothetical protein